MVNGTLAERLGSGLQHHLQRFESARYLFKIPKLLLKRLGIFCYFFTYQLYKKYHIHNQTLHHLLLNQFRSLLLNYLA